MKYEPSYDGLRAFAVSAVVLFHFWAAIFPGGWAGVHVFFVLSGYLITSILLKELKNTDKINLKRFYLRRVLRLTPALVCIILFQVARLVVSHDPESRKTIEESIVAVSTYVMNWAIAFHFLSADIIPHTWSLSVEEQFYLIWPALLLLVAKRRPLTWVCVAIIGITLWRIALVVGGASHARIYYAFDTEADALLIGCAIALISIAPALVRLASRFVLLPVAMLIAQVFLPDDTLRITDAVGYTVLSACTGWILIALQEEGRLKRWLSWPPFVYTGRISYGWYLWHNTLIRFLKPVLLHHGPLKTVMYVLLLPGSYLIAVASYRFIETPFLRLKARFEPKADRAPPPASDKAAAPDTEVA
jgi:peptidoglycan/LPS O-acetylase OafA/YrhL